VPIHNALTSHSLLNAVVP